ncbi:class I SAM-dependent methyltransferase [Mycobacterium servetii]|uniref:Class I SAM-dependent methyltransferase n=1 Tax=Mycobacterium servetii TaxID=3237418 RepID=A0ABV4BXT4_9MYCO
MNADAGAHTAVARAQESEYGEGHDYAVSPHIRHATLRGLLESRIEAVVKEVLARQGSCAVLEVGAGHGTFTDAVIRAGGIPTVTEMSRTSFDFLRRKFSDSPDVCVRYDSDGTAWLDGETQFDLILLISVLHHIPDYLGVVAAQCDNALRPGGSVLTFQDPLWYPRQGKLSKVLSWGSYFAWRIGQGELKRGVRTRARRLRGIYDESEPSDMVEYHVVRQGVDERALIELLGARFAEVELDAYFSTPLPALQAVGAKYFPPNTFGILARGRKADADIGQRQTRG